MLRILIVDDEPVARRVLAEELATYQGVEIVGEAATGKDAIGKIADLEPDVVFLDLNMPEMGGMDVMRAPEVVKASPVMIIVTAHDDRIEAALGLGAFICLNKPVSPLQLSQVIQEVRNRRQ